MNIGKIAIILSLVALVGCGRKETTPAPKANLNYLGVIAKIYKNETIKTPAINDKRQAELLKEAQ